MLLRPKFLLAPVVLAVLVTLALPACKGTLGGVKLNVTLLNDTKTQCLIGWAKTAAGDTSYSDLVPRTNSTFVFGIQETPNLVGDITVGVDLFSTPNCTGTQYWSHTEPTTLVRGKVTTLNITFDFGAPDGGTDGGVDDGGTDGGCQPAQCTSPPTCRTTPGTCSAGACQYPPLMAGTACDGGVCNGAGACGSNTCAFAMVNDPCNDGLSCTTDDRCANTVTCRGACQPVVCGTRDSSMACGTDGGCLFNPSAPNSSCGSGGRCNGAFTCVPWFPFVPSNLPDDVQTLPLPTAGWTAANASDGGPCIIDTTTPGPRDVASNCGFTGTAQVYAPTDGGAAVAVFSATTLSVPAGVEVQFVGSRPAVLAIYGDATIFGTLSAAAAVGAEPPAGATTAACLTYSPLPDDKGGEGGSYRSLGGRGGNNGSSDAGLLGTDTAIPLRAGCAGSGGGGPTPGDGGVGGGALQLTVMGALTVGDGGVLSVSGAGGLGGYLDHSAAGGGGSGGTLLLEARQLVLLNCALTANGGGGGEGGKDGQPVGQSGANGSRTTAAFAPGGVSSAGGFGGKGASSGSAATNGNNGSGNEGGGGGGGGLGLIRLNSAQACVHAGDVRSGELKVSTPSCN
jgi:hypothetical protein